MDKKDSIAEVEVAKSTWPYKLEKKGKALDQVEGPGHNTILSRPPSQYGDE